MEETSFYFSALFFHSEDPLVSFEVHIPWQIEDHYSMLGNCKYPGLYICKCSLRQECACLPWLAFCIPWYLLISGAPHTSSLAFLIIACKTFFFLHTLLRSLLFLIKISAGVQFKTFRNDRIPNSTLWWMEMEDCDGGFDADDRHVCSQQRLITSFYTVLFVALKQLTFFFLLHFQRGLFSVLPSYILKDYSLTPS